MHRFLCCCFFLLASTITAPAQDAPLPPVKATEAMKLPEGFRATVVGAEPQIVKPIGMTLDDRGRLWVIESHSYPHWLTEGKEGTDRILIFDDRKGAAEPCKVVWDRGTNLSGIAVGFGGVWLCATPKLLFLPLAP